MEGLSGGVRIEGTRTVRVGGAHSRRTERNILDRYFGYSLHPHHSLINHGREYLASADTTIKLWMKYKPIRTLSGHTGAVRGLTLINDLGFASCSNDGYEQPAISSLQIMTKD